MRGAQRTDERRHRGTDGAQGGLGTAHPPAPLSRVHLSCTLQVASACPFWSVSWKKPKPPQLESAKTKVTESTFRLISGRDRGQDGAVHPAHPCHQSTANSAAHPARCGTGSTPGRGRLRPTSPPPLRAPSLCAGRDTRAGGAALTQAGETA